MAWSINFKYKNTDNEINSPIKIQTKTSNLDKAICLLFDSQDVFKKQNKQTKKHDPAKRDSQHLHPLEILASQMAHKWFVNF